jgi:predicted RND superfamily exporter protein
MNKLGTLIVSHPKSIIAATLGITLVAAVIIGVRGVGFNGSLETLAQRNEDFQFYNETKASFGDDRVIVVGLTGPDVFTPEFIERLSHLTSSLSSIKGVAETQSLTNIKAIRREDGGISVERLIHANPSEKYLADLNGTITADPLYRKNLISEDGRTAAINVFLAPLDEAESRAVADQVEQVAKSEAAGYDLMLAGVPVMDARGIRSMLRDMLTISPAAAFLCLAIFYLAFRSFWGAVLPVSALVIGLTWVLGLMSLLGRQITIATLSLPTVLIAVGGSYMFHVLNQYRLSMSQAELDCQSESPDIAYDASAHIVRSHWRRRCHSEWLSGLSFLIPAVFVSGLITIAGFGALASSSIPAARDMGLFEAIGVGAVLLLTLTFVPAVLAILPRGALGNRRLCEDDYATALKRPLQNATALVLFHPRRIWVGTLALTVLMTAGIARLEVNTDYLKIFPRSSQTVRDAEKLHERLAGAATLELVVSGAGGGLYEPAFMSGVASLERFALTQQGVDSAISIADVVKRIDSLSDKPSGTPDGIPADRTKIESIFRDYLSQEDSLSRLADKSGSSAIIVLRTNLFSSKALRKLTSSVGEWSRNHLPSTAAVRATGSVVLLNDASDAVASSQISSLAIALVSIYLMTVVLFGSFLIGILALAPNLLPIMGFFGFLGWTGIPLDITTSLVATAALGLAVDNAVHMIRRYRQCSGIARDEGWAMWLTMFRTGKPMVLANVMLIAAFMVFMVSEFVPVRLGGLLWVVTIAACLSANLLFLPVLFRSKIFAARKKESRAPIATFAESKLNND